MEKVLIAIKSEMLAALLATSLPQYDVQICHTGSEALAFLDTLRPDILILGLSLPDMNGLTVLGQSTFKPSVILALSTIATDRVISASLAAGVQDIILIPCTIQHVLDHLDILIKKAPSLEG